MSEAIQHAPQAANERPINSRFTGRLAWANLALSATLMIIALALMFIGDAEAIPTTFGSQELDALFGMTLLTFPAVGALVASRRPANPIGWLFCAIGLAWALNSFAHEYAAYALIKNPGSLPAGEAFAWLQSWLFFPGLLAVPSLFCLVFPDGRLLSSRWRPIAYVSAVSIAIVCLGVRQRQVLWKRCPR